MDGFMVFSKEMCEMYKEEIESAVQSTADEFQWKEEPESTDSARDPQKFDIKKSFVREDGHILLLLNNLIHSEEQLYTETPRIFQIYPLENDEGYENHVLSIFTPVKRFRIIREVSLVSFKEYLEDKKEPGDIYENLVTNPITRLFTDDIESLYTYLFNYPNPFYTQKYQSHQEEI